MFLPACQHVDAHLASARMVTKFWVVCGLEDMGPSDVACPPHGQVSGTWGFGHQKQWVLHVAVCCFFRKTLPKWLAATSFSFLFPLETSKKMVPQKVSFVFSFVVFLLVSFLVSFLVFFRFPLKRIPQRRNLEKKSAPSRRDFSPLAPMFRRR